MSSPAEAIRRKPVSSTSPVCLCMCGHAHSQGSGCESCRCQKWRPRPCRYCGCPQSVHGQSSEACTSYEPDQSPEWLLRQGIGATRGGGWLRLPAAQLRYLMRPKHAGEENDPRLRVWACLILHTHRRRGSRLDPWQRDTKGVPSGRRALTRLAVIWDERRKIERPLKPIDIVNALNDVDPMRRMTGAWCRRILLDLEREGTLRQAGKRVRNGHLLFMYAKPISSRQVAGEPELVRKVDWTVYFPKSHLQQKPAT
jgi:hypothetical protein